MNKCEKCGQTEIPFRYGVCRICGEQVSDVIFVRDIREYLKSNKLIEHKRNMQSRLMYGI